MFNEAWCGFTLPWEYLGKLFGCLEKGEPNLNSSVFYGGGDVVFGRM